MSANGSVMIAMQAGATGVLNIGGMSADYPPLSIMQWVGALIMVAGIFLIAVNPADHLAKRKEQNNEE